MVARRRREMVLSRPEQLGLQHSAQFELSFRLFRYFAFYAWPFIEPGRRLLWNWHLSVVCDDLQDFTRPLWDPTSPPPTKREIVICVPPRSLKSYLMMRTLQAWLWLYAPWVMMQGISNDENLSISDALRFQTLILSWWYQALVMHAHVVRGGDPDDGLPWGVHPRQATKANFLNTMGGGRIALGVESTITGKGADLQGVDDPYDAKKATRGSPMQVARRMAQVVDDYDHVWKSRLNDPERSLRASIMQRQDPGDLAGVLIGRGARCIVLPMEYDPDFPAELGGVHPRDPRRIRGELLMPTRWSPTVWSEMKEATRTGDRHLQAQYNQRPRPADGGLFKPSYFERRYPDDPQFLECDEIEIFMDCSFTDSADSSFVVLQAWARRARAWFGLLDQIRAQMEFVAACDALVRMTSKWPRYRKVVVENKANGHATISVMKRTTGVRIVPWDPGVKSKYERAEIGSVPAMQAGQVWFPSDKYAPWLKGYIDRHLGFDGSGSVPDDEIDTTSMALLSWTGGAEDPLSKLKKRLGGLV